MKVSSNLLRSKDYIVLKVVNFLRSFLKKDCVFDYEYSTGFPVTFKPETVVALKSVIDLDTIIVENGLIEI